MAPLPIFRIDKIKVVGAATPTSAMGHLARTRDTANADPSRLDLNRWLVGDAKLNLGRAIDDRLKDAGIVPRAGATIAVSFLLGASATLFQPDAKMGYGQFDMGAVESFVKAAQIFMAKAFGEHLVCAVLHLDEAVPHVQGVMVPILQPRKRKTHRLSAKDFFDRNALRHLQNEWEKLLKPMGVGERLVGSAANHTTNKRFHSSVAEIAAQVDGFEWMLAPSPLPGSDPDQNKAALGAWHKEQVAYIKRTIHPLAQAAVYGRMAEAEARKVQKLAQLLDLAKTRLREAAREIDARLDLSIPLAAMVARFWSFVDR